MTALFSFDVDYLMRACGRRAYDVRTNDLPLARKHLDLPFWRQIGCLTILFIRF